MSSRTIKIKIEMSDGPNQDYNTTQVTERSMEIERPRALKLSLLAMLENARATIESDWRYQNWENEQ